MAKLDLVTLAEFARVDPDGLLTIVGGGFTEASAERLPSQLPVYVPFRVSLTEGEDPPTFRLTASPPNDQYEIQLEGQVPPPTDAKSIEGEYGLPVVLSLLMAIPEPGIYRVRLGLSTGEERELRFRVNLSEPS